ncbi:MFS transporter [Paraburkholderia aspalathi]|uniref:Tartrate transporter n=2 Tax=Paraburkholderia nemoris TaxID=2793076 RepID=A0ABN7M6D8_9BURK|nr:MULTISPECIES: MFS transporter [Paraburkholderia]MBK3812885.1 MFS transporter [Paraburkholderia aspalathi]CAE6788104.1 Putative tartrate transporter [Paraburkholderia nemoris]
MKSQKDWVTTTSQAHSRGERDRVVRKIMWRLLPFLFVAYVFCYIDRVNIGFAALTMNKDLGLTASEFGFGAGLFFIGYFIFEVPSNLLMQRFGPRVWIARIMISWGVISAFCAFVQGPITYGIVRFLLGLAEAGFTPGIFLFLTLWFPSEARNRATAIFMASVPVANIVGSLLSGTLLSVRGFAGLKDWQALLVLEALPAVILGILCLFVLVDRPRDARWLTADERLLIENELSLERQALAARHGDKLRGALSDWKVYALAGIYFCYICGSVGIGLWLPQIIHGFGLKAAEVGVVAAVPYACGAVGMVFWSSLAGNGPRRIRFAAGAMLVAAITLAASAAIEYPLLKMIGITLTVTFMLGFQAIFLSLPSGFLTGRAAAGGLAVIISIGNLGGFAGPYLIGYVKQTSGSFTTALLLVAFALLVAAVGTWLLGDPADRIDGKRRTLTSTVKV